MLIVKTFESAKIFQLDEVARIPGRCTNIYFSSWERVCEFSMLVESQSRKRVLTYTLVFHLLSGPELPVICLVSPIYGHTEFT